MATRRWLGTAPAVAQVTPVTPANVEIGDVFMLTINNKSVSFTAAAATVANVTAGLVAAWNASTEPEFAEITASDETTRIDLTADTAGKPFTVTATATDGGGTDDQTLTVGAASTTNSGPNDWGTAANWSGGAVPVNDDTVVIEDSDVDIKYGLDQSSVELDGLTIAQSYTGEIGLPLYNEDSTAYAEYRDRFLKVAFGATNPVNIGEGNGSGSPRIQLDLDASAAVVSVFNSGNAADNEYAAIQVVNGNGASFYVYGGSVDVEYRDTVGTSINDLIVAGGAVRVGDGVTTIEDADIGGGTVELRNTGIITGLDITGGNVTHRGGAVTAASVRGGTLDYRSDSTLSALTLNGSGAVVDFDNDARAVTVTDTTLTEGTIRDKFERVTWTNGVQPGRNLSAVA